MDFEGNYDAKGHRYALVCARFNQPITNLLLEGAVDGLLRHGAVRENLSIAWVPGAFEIPLAAKALAETKKYDAVICLGAVIRGETSHFDFVAGQAAAGILNASLDTGIPIIFSVLTTDTKEQAEVRAGTKGMNMGFCGALSAIEMVNLLQSIVTIHEGRAKPEDRYSLPSAGVKSFQRQHLMQKPESAE